MVLSPFITEITLYKFIPLNIIKRANKVVVKVNLSIRCFNFFNRYLLRLCYKSGVSYRTIKPDKYLIYSTDLNSIMDLINLAPLKIELFQLLVETMNQAVDLFNPAWVRISKINFFLETKSIRAVKIIYSWLGKITSVNTKTPVCTYQSFVDQIMHRLFIRDESHLNLCQVKLYKGHLRMIDNHRKQTARLSISLDHSDDISVNDFLQWLITFPNLQVIDFYPSMNNAARDQKIMREYPLYLNIGKLVCVTCKGYKRYIKVNNSGSDLGYQPHSRRLKLYFQIYYNGTARPGHIVSTQIPM